MVLKQVYCFFIVLLFLPIAAETQVLKPPPGRQEIPQGTSLKGLLEKPDLIYTKVTSLREGDKVWIGMAADVQVCTTLPLEKIKAVISDYAAYDRIFRRTTASRIVRRDSRGTEAFFEVTVGAMGITVVSGYTVFLEEILNSPGSYCLVFTHVSDDGTIRNVQGFWYLEAVEIDGLPCTYFRYHSSYDSLKSSFLQKQATSLFIGAENTAMVREVLGAAAR